MKSTQVEILPESLSTYLGDGTLLEIILGYQADIVGFSVFSWNLDRSLHLARELSRAYGPRIIFGGPEVTPDNPAVRSEYVDFYVYGEGEVVFTRLLEDPSFWNMKQAALPADHIFAQSPSPYMTGLLEPDIEDMVLLETQRGCPYHCGYCYYPKSRDRIAVKDESKVTEAIAWARERDISELYLLDPSLNARPGLTHLLEKIQSINSDRRLSLLSEIRAEAIDDRLASLLAGAGFSWFEIGLQTIQARALKIMRRSTHLDRFLEGVGRLKDRGITPGIDLIAGLPGDQLSSFCESADFVRTRELHQDAQVFPLSVLPGTDFRRHSRELGLQYNPHPPYTVSQAPDFPEEHILLAFDYTENTWEASLHPLPDLDISWRNPGPDSLDQTPDLWVEMGGRRYLNKLVLEQPRPLSEIQKCARMLTHPYQVFIGPQLADQAFLGRALETITRINPHIPFELVFLEPENMPGRDRLVDAIKLDRPHFLDVEWRYMFPRPGNRAVLYTFVSSRRQLQFDPDMQRHVFWWKEPTLPDREDIASFDDLDGVLIDVDLPDEIICDWQDRLAPDADEDLVLTFSRIPLQNRWRKLTKDKDYYWKLFPQMVG